MEHEHTSMECPRCAGVGLRPVMTKQGVEIDRCDACGGIWLDRGEIYHFAKRAKPLIKELRRASADARPGPLKSPKTGRPMDQMIIFDSIEIDQDPDTGGIWLDRGELKQVVAAGEASLKLDVIPPSAPPAFAPGAGSAMDPTRLAAYGAGMGRLPNLFIRSAGILVFLYGMLAALLIVLVETTGMPPGAAVVIGVIVAGLQFGLGPFFMDLSLRWFYQARVVDRGELPEHLEKFVDRVAADRKIKFPRFAIIDDGAPNAFTYGHYPSNARIVITRGLMELLDEDELEAVVAHEIGHAIHWDMLVMTMAYLVPLIAYYVYRTLIRIRSRGNDRSAPARYAIALGAFVVYIISEYIVLWLSRTREYKADNFAGRVKQNPNALASALVKIGYGLAGRKSAKAQAKEAKEAGTRRAGNLEALGAMGIFDSGAARAMAVASSGSGSAAFSTENLKGAMRWDLWNPWAKFYELGSTHPLIAKRLDMLSRLSAKLGLSPLVVFDEVKPESYWDEFLVDVFFHYLPLLGPLGFLAAGLVLEDQMLLMLAVAGYGAGKLCKTLWSYKGGVYPEMSVAAMLKKVKVSAVRGVPVTIRGTVIGRGVPGLIWSEDFVIQDDTGIIFLDYRQPLRIFEFLFGLLRRKQMEGTEVVATGWYRRAPVPFIELRDIITGGKRRRCWVFTAKLIWSLAMIGLGLYLAFGLQSHIL